MTEHDLPDPHLTQEEARALARAAGLLSSALERPGPEVPALVSGQMKLEVALAQEQAEH